MLKAGYTAVCEFHYLHNQPDGTPYAERAAMSQALIDAATTAGIGLTLLPTLYQTADFGGAEPTARQRQFVLAIDQYLDLVDDLSRVQSPQIEVGVALHSLRAGAAGCHENSSHLVAATKAIHIHIAEQDRELQQPSSICMHGRSNGCSSMHAWIVAGCLVHATHSTHAELKAVAATGACRWAVPDTKQILATVSSRCPRGSAAGGTFAIGSDSHISLSPTARAALAGVRSATVDEASQRARDAGDMSTGAMLWRHACTRRHARDSA
jgi:formimidoylglutamate deiminase